jgi:hypothetical protein
MEENNFLYSTLVLKHKKIDDLSTVEEKKCIIRVIEKLFCHALVESVAKQKNMMDLRFLCITVLKFHLSIKDVVDFSLTHLNFVLI